MDTTKTKQKFRQSKKCWNWGLYRSSTRFYRTCVWLIWVKFLHCTHIPTVPSVKFSSELWSVPSWWFLLTCQPCESTERHTTTNGLSTLIHIELNVFKKVLDGRIQGWMNKSKSLWPNVGAMKVVASITGFFLYWFFFFFHTDFINNDYSTMQMTTMPPG